MAIELAPLHIDTLISSPVRVDLLRLDRIHPFVSGNKYFKLKYNLEQALADGADRMISFGGAYSNHLHALAWAAQVYGIPCTGIVRGEAVNNSTLNDCKAWGMDLVFISRSGYQQKREAAFLQQLQAQYPKAYIIPEGGDNELGLLGCEHILDGIDMSGYQHLICAVGTGTTMAGLARSMPETCMAWGVPVFKNHAPTLASLREKIPHRRWGWLPGFEAGGFGRFPESLQEQTRYYEKQFGVELDRVYTAKMLWATLTNMERGLFPADSSILTVHTGGLQGNRSNESSKF